MCVCVVCVVSNVSVCVRCVSTCSVCVCVCVVVVCVHTLKITVCLVCSFEDVIFHVSLCVFFFFLLTHGLKWY